MADPHIAAEEGKIVRGINMAGHFRKMSAELLAMPRRPAGVFVLGDCAFNSGEAEDYATLATLLDPLRAGGLPLHLALGNHDKRDTFWATFKARERVKVKNKHVALVRNSQVNWFMLDSLETTLQTPGSLGAEQLAWLARNLDDNPDKPALVLVHHHPGDRENVSGLKDTETLLDFIRPRKQVKAWFFGHTHRWNVRTDDSGLHLVNLPPLAYVFQSANPSGWVHANIREDGVDLELRSVNQEHKNHGQVVVLKWR